MSDKPGPSTSSGSGKEINSTANDEALAELLAGGGFAIYPLPWCPHLESITESTTDNVKVTSPCAECGETVENWLCLFCNTTHCSRYIIHC